MDTWGDEGLGITGEENSGSDVVKSMEREGDGLLLCQYQIQSYRGMKS